MFLITDTFFFPRGHRTSTCPLGWELTLILVSFTFEKSCILQCRRLLPIAITNKNIIYLSVWNWRFPVLGSLEFYSSCFQLFLFSFFTVKLHSYPVKDSYSLYERNSYKLPGNTRSWNTSEELLPLLLLLSLLLLLPFGMISIYSLASSHDDAVTIVVELMTTSGCLRYSAYRIVFYPARRRIVVFCLVWRFPSSFKKKVRLCIGGITLQECGGGFCWLLRRGLHIHKPLKSRQFLAILAFS